MTFALAIEVLLAQIAVPALEEDRKQTQFIFFAELGHGGSEDGLSKRANTQLASNARQLFDLVRIKERRFKTAVFVVATALCRRKTLRRC
jgi:hypothetical protein